MNSATSTPAPVRAECPSQAAGGFPWLQRGEFSEAPSGLLYLNAASKTPLPASVEEAGKIAVSAQVNLILSIVSRVQLMTYHYLH